MISMFLHLLLLAYGSVSGGAYAGFMPLTLTVCWAYASMLVLFHWLPAIVDRRVEAGQIPSFGRAQEVFQWALVLWILLLHKAADPVTLMFPEYARYLPQTLPMLLSLVLYVSLARPVTFELYRLFRPILDVQQTCADFFRARMTVPILFFPPVILWMLIEDLGSGGMASLVEIRLMAVAPFFFIGLYLLSPKLFNLAWRAEINRDEGLDKMIGRLSEKADTPVSGVRIWDTFKEPVPNAAVAGLSKRYRFVYITRYLLCIFTPAQIEGVVAHELGHLRLGHVATYMIYSMNLMLLSVTIKLGLIAYFPVYYSESTLAAFVEAVFFIAVFALSFTAIARYCEYQADGFAIAITCPQTFASGLERLGSMVLPPSLIIPRWLLTHPQIQDRIDRVRNGVRYGVDNLLYRARAARYAMLVLGVLLLIAASYPASAVFNISDYYDAVQAGNCRLALNLHESLPEWLKSHPLVLQESGKLAVNSGNWLLATIVAVKAAWGISIVPVSEILHHAGAPEVALDFEVMKFVLKSFDLG
ncbi:MAG: hypothetical protein EOM80_09065 [Erysipelotrichia bacterium]|nr:hypothetical protein [Erysipelotrichia bacterium]